jgi:hypothetical protein
MPPGFAACGALQQLGQLDAQRLRQAPDHRHRRVGLAALDLAEHALADAGAAAQLVERQARLRALRGQGFPDARGLVKMGLGWICHDGIKFDIVDNVRFNEF